MDEEQFFMDLKKKKFAGVGNFMVLPMLANKLIEYLNFFGH